MQECVKKEATNKCELVSFFINKIEESVGRKVKTIQLNNYEISSIEFYVHQAIK